MRTLSGGLEVALDVIGPRSIGILRRSQGHMPKGGYFIGEAGRLRYRPEDPLARLCGGLNANVFKGVLYVAPAYPMEVAVKVWDFNSTQQAEALASACRLGGLLPLLARSPTLLTTYRVELQTLADRSLRLLQIMRLCPTMLDSLLREASTVPRDQRMLLELPDWERKMPEGARDVKGARAGCLLRPLSAGIPWYKQWYVLVSVLRGLWDLHNAGLVMVDLKLDNIALENDERLHAVLLDFETCYIIPTAPGGAGSFVIGKGCSEETKAPELDIEPFQPSPASDVFAFGIIVLQLVLVQWEAMALREAVRVAHASADPVSALDDVLDGLGVPNLVKDFVLPCLHKDPAHRPMVWQLLRRLEGLQDFELMDECLTAELGWRKEEEMLRGFVTGCAQREKDLADARATAGGAGGEAVAEQLRSNRFEFGKHKVAADKAKLDGLTRMAMDLVKRL